MYLAGSPGPSPNDRWVQFFQQQLSQQQQAPGNNLWYAETGNELALRWAGPSAKQRGPLLKIADVKWEFWRYSDRTIRSLAAKLNEAGFLEDVNAPKESVWDAYRHVLMEAAQSYAANGGSAPTVQQILNKYLRSPVGGSSSAGVKKPDIYTQTQSRTDLTDPKRASAMLTQVLQDRLGRAPSASERHAFVAALNAEEEANPVVTKTTYKLNHESDSYDSSSKTTGGVDPTGYLQSYSEKHNQKEYGAYQAATTYMNAFLSAVGAPVD